MMWRQPPIRKGAPTGILKVRRAVFFRILPDTVRLRVLHGFVRFPALPGFCFGALGFSGDPSTHWGSL